MKEEEFEELSIKIILSEASDKEVQFFRSECSRNPKAKNRFRELRDDLAYIDEAVIIDKCIKESGELARSASGELADEKREKTYQKRDSSKVVDFIKLSLLPLAACIVFVFTLKLAFFDDSHSGARDPVVADSSENSRIAIDGSRQENGDLGSRELSFVSARVDISSEPVSLDNRLFTFDSGKGSSLRISIKSNTAYDSWVAQELRSPASLSDILGSRLNELRIGEEYELRVSDPSGGNFELLRFRLEKNESVTLLP